LPRQTADDQDQAGGAERERLVDRPPVVVECCAPAFAIDRGEHPAAAVAGYRETGIADAQRRVLQSCRRDLVAPWGDAANTVARAPVDDLRQRPLLADGRGVEGE